MTKTAISRLDGRRIELPIEWLSNIADGTILELEQTRRGILVRPQRSGSWDAVFANKLEVGSGPGANDDLEVRGSDLY